MLNRKESSILLIIMGALLLRLFALQAVPLLEDETDITIPIAQSISFSPKQLNLPLGSSLTKHPLLCSYLIKLGMSIFGNNKWGVRLPFVILNMMGFLFVYLLVKKGLGFQKARFALILIALSQYHIGISRIANTQSLELFFIPVILCTFYKLIATRKKYWIFSLAILLGIGYLAKTTLFLFIPIFLIFFAFSPKHRYWLREKALYLGSVITFIIISPSLYWNFNNRFVNFNDSLKDIGMFGVSLRAFALYFGELSVFLWDHCTINRVCSTEYPFMHWVMGLLAFAGVIYSFKQKDSDLIKLLLITFCFIFGACSFIKGPPGNLFLDSFWWAQMSFIPSVILASNMLIDLTNRHKWIKFLLFSLVVYLILRAGYFVNIHENNFLAYM